MNIKDIIESLACPFTVQANYKENEDDVRRAEALNDLINYDWESGGKYRFFDTFGREYVKDIISQKIRIDV